MVESSVRISSHSGVSYISISSGSGLGLGLGLLAVLFLSAMLTANGWEASRKGWAALMARNIMNNVMFDGLEQSKWLEQF